MDKHLKLEAKWRPVKYARTNRAPSRRTTKEHGKPVRKERAKLFQWAFVTGGSVPRKYSWGIP